MKWFFSNISRDFWITLCVALGGAFCIRSWFLETYFVSDDSKMRPTLVAGDFLLINKWRWKRQRKSLSSGTLRGKVIAWQHGNTCSIGRLIALPGDEVRLREGKIQLNGHWVTHPATPTEALPGHPAHNLSGKMSLPEDGPQKVTEGFVLVVQNNWKEGRHEDQHPLENTFHSSPSAGQIGQPAEIVPVWHWIPLDSILGITDWIWLSVIPGHSWIPHLRWERIPYKVR